MGLAFALIIVFALALIAAPIALNIIGHGLGAMSSSIMLGSGVLLLIVCVILAVVTKLYVKTKASEAFVRTGMGGLRVIRDGGAIVLPVVHQVVRVSLETIRLEVLRQGVEALITSDKLRADIKAEFFVRVQPDDEAIQAAARSLGDKGSSDMSSRRDGIQSSVAMLIEDKLVSALRTAAARKTLEQLNSERDEFLKEVVQLVTGDLAHNGFTLETVTISKLDQTDEANLKANNIFDAQGMRTIAEITQKNLTERNAIVRSGEQARTAQDVETRKQVLALEQDKARAEAEQAASIAGVTAEQDRLAKEKQIEAARSVEVAQVAQQQAIEVAKRAQQQAIEVAERDKQKAITEADQKVAVALRSQQQAVAKAEAEKASAEAKLADAEAERQRARQNIVTVETLATADREKQKAVMAASAAAEQQLVTAQKKADAEAYQVRTQADARMASAVAEASAVTKKAEAEAEAQRLSAGAQQAVAVAQAEGKKAALMAEAEGQKSVLLAQAEGQKATAMVPVEVKAREVEIDQRRVTEVLQPEMQARATYGESAQQFELAKFRIEKEAEVRIEAARAMVHLSGKITANVFGTPEDVAKMNEAFSRGMGLSNLFGGFLAGADTSTLKGTEAVVDATLGVARAVAERIKPSSAAKPDE